MTITGQCCLCQSVTVKLTNSNGIDITAVSLIILCVLTATMYGILLNHWSVIIPR